MNIRVEPPPVAATPAVESVVPARIAVVMAAHNAERTIVQAVESLGDEACPCRIYIVDDASRIPVNQIPALAHRDNIEFIRLDRSAGPAAARNEALTRILANGHDYVAVMDADDVALPGRLAKQAAFLDAHPAIALVGCWERVIEEYSGKVLNHVSLPCTPHEIRRCLYMKMCVSHPTWMVRASVLAAVGFYATAFPAAEDYELLRRIVAHFDVANLSEYLLDYRLSSGGISLRRRDRQLVDRLRIQLRYFAPLNWRAWVGVVRTLALLLLRVKRPVPAAIGTPAAKRLHRT